MKQRFKYITVNFAMFWGAETRNKCQSLPISKDHLVGLSDENSEETTAVNEIIKYVTFLCGFDTYTIFNIEGISGGITNETK